MKTVELFSERLKLRLIQFSDLNAIHTLHSLPEIDEYNTLGIPDSIEVTEKIIKPQISAHQQEEILNYTFAVEQAATETSLVCWAWNYGRKKTEEGKYGTNCIQITGEMGMQPRR